MHFRIQLIITVTLLNLLVAVPFSHAQDRHTGFEVSYELREARRKAVIAENFVLTEAEAQKFWPIYNAYRAKIKDKAKALIELLQPFAGDMSGISNEKSKSIVKRALDMEIGYQKLNNKYMLDLQSKSILSGTKLLRYYQIELRLNAIFKDGLTETVPLVPDNNTSGNNVSKRHMQQQQIQQKDFMQDMRQRQHQHQQQQQITQKQQYEQKTEPQQVQELKRQHQDAMLEHQKSNINYNGISQ